MAASVTLLDGSPRFVSAPWCQEVGVRRLTVHDALPTCATLLVDLDVHPRAIIRVLRHADQAVTMEIYEGQLREALRWLGEGWTVNRFGPAEMRPAGGPRMRLSG
jgi:integrase